MQSKSQRETERLDQMLRLAQDIDLSAFEADVRDELRHVRETLDEVTYLVREREQRAIEIEEGDA